MINQNPLPKSHDLRVGLLGMADNMATHIVLAELDKQGIKIGLLILQQPDFRGQWRRLKRKIAAGGPLAASKRIVQSLFLRRQIADPGAGTVDFRKYDVLYTADSNSEQCVSEIRRKKIDLLLACTDTMLKRRLFSAPRIATLNAHPGWVPGYRGLGAMVHQFGNGFGPAITVHVIDEGVDTGPVLLRKEFDIEKLVAADSEDTILHSWQALCFAEVVKRVEKHGQLQFIDTFLEPSNMTRGVPHKKTATIMEQTRRDPTSLRSLSTRQEGN